MTPGNRGCLSDKVRWLLLTLNTWEHLRPSARWIQPQQPACATEKNTAQAKWHSNSWKESDRWRCERTHILYSHTHLCFFASTVHACLNLQQLSHSVSPVCSLHSEVFHLLAWELAMLSVMEVGVPNPVSHVRANAVYVYTARHSHAQLPKFKQTCSALILTISAYHSIRVHSTNLQFLSAEDQWVVFPFLLHTLLAFYPARYRKRHLISPRHCFMKGFHATLPWHTVRLHSDYEHLNTGWQRLPCEGLTIMFH